MKRIQYFLLAILFILPLSAKPWSNILSSYRIVEIIPYDDGYWFATEYNGAIRYDNNENQWHFYKQSDEYFSKIDNIHDMIIANSRVWFATTYGIYSCALNGTRWSHDMMPGTDYSNWVRGFSANSDSLFVASFTGLITKPFASNTYKAHEDFLPSSSRSGMVTTIFATDTVVWIGSENGVFEYNPRIPVSNPSSFTYYSKSDAFDTGSDYVDCECVYQGKSGVWIGLEEYTSSNNPQFCLGGLFHYDGEIWTKYDESIGLPADGIHFVKEHGNKIFAGLFHYVDGVSYDGAGLLVLDVTDNSWIVLDKNNWEIGSNDVRSFYCNETDTIVGTEHGLYSNVSELQGIRPYAAPQWFSLRHLGNGSLEVQVDSVYRANKYRIYCSQDGINFTDTLYISSECDTIEGLELNKTYSFKIAGANESGVGPLCKDILTLRANEGSNEILLIQGFDLGTVGNTYDFSRDHGRAISNAGHGFDAISDEALFNTSIDIKDYTCVDWITGMDNNSFMDDEKDVLANYLENGGKLFVSGSQIIENVYSVKRDAKFYSTYFKAQWKNRTSSAYSTENLKSGLFNGVEDIYFDDGTHDIYKVLAPDGFKPVGGAEATMIYSQLDSASNGCAGLQYRGTFGTSSVEGQLIYLGFPLESVYPDSMQDVIMKCVLNYFNFDVEMTDVKPIDLPEICTLEQNYPNPFNPMTSINFHLSANTHVDLSIYDVKGKKIATLISGNKAAGSYNVNWDASPYSSGLYVYRLQAGDYVQSRKMLLMK